MIKNIFITFLFFLIFSCDNLRDSEANNQPNDSETRNVEIAEIEKNDSLKFPLWLGDIYPDSVEIDYAYYYKTQKVKYFKQLNDSLSICIIETEDGICLKYFLSTIIDGNEFQKVEISTSCDHEQSNPVYSWSSYLLLNDTVINSTEYVEYIPKKFLNKEGMIETGKSFNDYETYKDSSMFQYKILMNGIIKMNILNKPQ